ncbi:MAG TPA: hypothetical protein VKS79_13455 [Gemmataceae bacterium]|nr:hypothetical protein [Gemmataceae bacterium]
MSDYAEQVRSLLEEAGGLPTSPTQLALLEEAVHLADTHHDIRLGVEARRPLMYVARYLLRGDILTVAFTWCLAHYDREPALFGGRDLLWEYGQVIGQLANLHDVSRQTLEQMLEDFGRRLLAGGESQLQVYLKQRHIAPDLGDRELGRTANQLVHEEYRKLGRGPTVDERTEEIELELFLGNEERALELAKRFLHGDWRGYVHSGGFAPYLLLPLHKHDRRPEAAALYKRCRTSFHPERCYYWPYGEFIKWLTLTGANDEAVQVYAKCQRAIKPYTDPLTRLHFALDATVLFDRLAKTGPAQLPLRLGEVVPVGREDGRYEVAQLHNWLHQEARELAARFDARNGTDCFQQQIQARAELQKWADGNAAVSPA